MHTHQEVTLNWSKWIPQVHRWLSIIFTAVVIAIFITLGVGEGTRLLGVFFAAVSARLTHAYRSVHVRAALCRQVA